MHQMCADGEDLVIWPGEKEEATSVMVQAVSAVEACWSCGHFTTMYDELQMICAECFYTNMKKGHSDPTEDTLLLYFLHTH